MDIVNETLKDFLNEEERFSPAFRDSEIAHNMADSHGLEDDEYTATDYIRDLEQNTKREKRSGAQSKFSVWVFEHPLNYIQNIHPKYIWTQVPDLYDDIRSRKSEICFNRKLVPSSKHGNLVPYGTLDKAASRSLREPPKVKGKRLGKPVHFTWDEWNGKDKFGRKQTSRPVDREVSKIKRAGTDFAQYVNT